jgi:hypothetical protein
MRLVTIFIALLFLSCGPSTVMAPAQPQLELRLTPRIVMAGSSLRVTCFVPGTYGAGLIRYGIEDLRISVGPLDLIENSLLIERMPCGLYMATCAVKTDTSTDRRELQISVQGCQDQYAGTSRQYQASAGW